jgi:hypothetical protein
MPSQSPLYNADAGLHPLPIDAREIAAVLRAGVRCYEAHPYFSARYGVRGEAFTRSDGGYLATLADHSQIYVFDQVMWLARVLANRGMPRWLMEVHLEILSEELTSALPGRASNYSKLQLAAQMLRDERQTVIPQTNFNALVAQFDSASGAGLEAAGGLLVAAVCDECCGLPEAVPSLQSWLGAPEHFPPQWCAAVSDTLARARALAAQRGGADHDSRS